jgi:hypothetical protein
MVAWPFEKARDVLRFYADFCATCPDDLMLNAGIICTPEGDRVVAILGAWLGNIDEGEERMAPVRQFGSPAADMMGPIAYTELNMLFDDGSPFGIPRYWKSGYFSEIGDELIERVIAYAESCTSSLSSILFFRIAGAATRGDPASTAFNVREPLWDFDIIAQWQNNTPSEKHIDWARRFWADVEPFSRGVYVNHLDADDAAARVRAAYGDNYSRLARLKRQYDPTNFFRMNNNIPPA